MADDIEKKEKMAFHELKRRMEGDMEIDLYNDDNLFYRFLRARDFKIDNAEQMLRRHLEWRKKYDLKNISEYKPPEVFEKYFILTLIGHEKEGCLLKYNHFGNSDYRGLIESMRKRDDWFKSLIHFFEKDVLELKRQTQKFGKIVEKTSYIVDLQNFSLSKATDKKVVSYIISTIIMYLDNYPETFKAGYAINAPVYFNLFFSVMKAFLPGTVIKKIKVYSDDSWKKELLELVDADVLPAFLGGNRTDPDGNPLCLTLIKNPEEVPKRYYIRKNRQFASLPNAQMIKVPNGEVHEMCFEVKEPGSHLDWEFQLKSGDIKFGIIYKDLGLRKTEVVPLQRINTDEFTESGIYKCENIGTYIAVFDNSHSFLRSKEIHYKIDLSNTDGVLSENGKH